ncbi:MAG: cupin domain-containing protein [Alphaproteobacteria bacterium]|nr:cupin domain-containing protein [Alphaproteobacteria bacterium]MBU1513487.1 cupin domain-containing protein [Alphaproteobacteria bacterium]MBU2096479.1 cupin domain-containing protein [Alphaproteobacteria bacterium]MBU2149829.1 cupin domain-containing protein [Alphaproteobacteria bacterium]MBU2305196.1 cupin domain-containing protein [Alphaproteobacteria bacterium]
MQRALPLLAILVIANPTAAQVPPEPGKPVIVDTTLSGQPIRPPQTDIRITITQGVIPVGGGVPAHKHPYPRLVNVLAGRMKVTNLDTGQVREIAAGDWLVDAVDQWHETKVIGDQPVRLLTIDQAPPGATVTVPRHP